VRLVNDVLSCAPTDLANFLACRFKILMDLAVATGQLADPRHTDAMADALRQRGERHEKAYIDTLRAEGLTVVDLTRPKDAGVMPAEALARTMAILRQGPNVVVQAAVGADGWFGYADVLRRVERPSALGGWSYEVLDTKLSRETRGGTILQLCAYTEMIGAMQDVRPDQFHVVTPARVESYRFDEFGAYYRLVKTRLRAFIDATLAGDGGVRALYPEPCEHCDLCRWSARCEAQRRADDHLSYVAGLARLQQLELEDRGITTLAAFGALTSPLGFEPSRGNIVTYEKLRHQAELQVRQRETRTPTYELLPVEPDAGLLRLPAPDPGDLFLDLEGDPFAREGGREYLFGLLGQGPRAPGPSNPSVSVSLGPGPLALGQQALPLGPGPVALGLEYSALWAFTDAEERAGFEAVIDRIIATLADHPGMHVYHYASYEPAAFKRLSARHATREAELDLLLRGGRFVDLYAVIRRGLRAGVESYSIKQMEPFYAFNRAVDLGLAGDERRIVELALETGQLAEITAAVRSAVAGYNEDDCRSTLELRDWLERLRDELIRTMGETARPVLKSGEGTEQIRQRDQRAHDLRAALLATIARDGGRLHPPFANPEHWALYVLAHLVDWHRREERVAYGEYHRLRIKSEEELRDEPRALVDLTWVERVSAPAGRIRAAIDRYRYPPQENDVRAGDEAKLPSDVSIGRVEAIDKYASTVDIKKRIDQNEVHPSTIIALDIFNAPKQEAAICRIAERVIEHGLARETVVRDLLLARPDAALAGFGTRPASESAAEFAVRIAGDLNGSQLAIQGPPGAGKTHTGARMIASLLSQGRKVGIVATGHKVIRKLLLDARRAAAETGVTIAAAHKCDESESPAEHEANVLELQDNPDAFAFIHGLGGRLLGGTAWLWAREEFQKSVDVLFVDEAGQMSLANVLAVSEAARSVVLLGDPQQLDQPQRASHPEGADQSALEHLLAGHQTIPPDKGLFLPTTWRLAPAICRFTSEVFYEGRLHALHGLECQVISGAGPLDGAGLRVVDVEHDHCRNASDEEVAVVAEIVTRLLQPGVTCVELDLANRVPRAPRQMQPRDILVVAPYNAHVARLRERLDPIGVAAGTVDKFQGQEAPVVIYSMATSRPEDAPRGMEFLYSLNRLNVATSRGKCLCVLVANPRLFEPDCKTPAQMRLANALCRYRELATPVIVEPLAPPAR